MSIQTTRELRRKGLTQTLIDAAAVSQANSIDVGRAILIRRTSDLAGSIMVIVRAIHGLARQMP